MHIDSIILWRDLNDMGLPFVTLHAAIHIATVLFPSMPIMVESLLILQHNLQFHSHWKGDFVEE